MTDPAPSRDPDVKNRLTQSLLAWLTAEIATSRVQLRHFSILAVLSLVVCVIALHQSSQGVHGTDCYKLFFEDNISALTLDETIELGQLECDDSALLERGGKLLVMVGYGAGLVFLASLAVILFQLAMIRRHRNKAREADKVADTYMKKP